jgi:hypothetical protein
MKIKITVSYESWEIDQKLDDKIRRALEAEGFHWYAQGYTFPKSLRELCFEKETTDE